MHAGERIGRYVIIDLLGKGGMGAVYRAFDPALTRKVAIKVLLTEDELGPDGKAQIEQARVRWTREAQMLAHVSHPNIVAIYEVGVDEGRAFMVMEYVEGMTLTRWMENGVQPWGKVLDAIVEAAHGLAAAHAVGIVHRDLKPDNILVASTGEVKVADFGLARLIAFGEESTSTNSMSRSGSSRASVDESLLTQVGDLVGTPAYMAPEQLAGRNADEQSDIFALCVTLYQGLYGVRPFRGSSINQMRDAIRAGELRGRDSAVCIPKWLDRIVVTGLSFHKYRRYSSIPDMLAAIEHGRTQGKRMLVRLAIGVGISSVLAVPMALPGTNFQLERECDSGEGVVSARWWQEAQPRVVAAFRATGVAYAQDVYERFAARMQSHVHVWEAQTASFCEDRSRAGDQIAPPVLEARLQCLRSAFDASSSFLHTVEKIDAAMVDQVLLGFDGLKSPEACLKEALRGKSSQGVENDDPLTRARNNEAGLAIARASLNARIGALDKAYADLSGLLHANFEELSLSRQAQVYLELSRIQNARRRFDNMWRLGEKARLLAVAGSDPEVSIHAIGESLSQARGREIADLVRDARAFVLRMGGDEGIELELSLRVVERERSRLARWQHPEAALAQYEEQLDILSRLYGPDDERLLLPLMRLSDLYAYSRNDLPTAQALINRAIAISERNGTTHSKRYLDLLQANGVLLATGDDLQGALHQAEKAARLALEMFGEQGMAGVPMRAEYAMLLAVAGDAKRAHAEFESVSRTYAGAWGYNDANYWYWRGTYLAVLKEALGQEKEALEDLRIFTSKYIDLVQRRMLGIDVFGQSGRLALRLGDRQLAEELLRRGKAALAQSDAADLDFATLYILAAQLAAADGKWQLANGEMQKWFRQALEELRGNDSDFRSLFVETAVAAIHVGEFDRAAALLDESREHVLRALGEESVLLLPIEMQAAELALLREDLVAAQQHLDAARRLQSSDLRPIVAAQLEIIAAKLEVARGHLPSASSRLERASRLLRQAWPPVIAPFEREISSQRSQIARHK